MSNKYLLRPDGYVLGEAPGSRIIISGSSDQVVTEFIGVSEPLLRLSNGETTVDLLGPGSGWKLDDPYWNPQIAQYKGGGIRVNSGVAEGQRLVHKEYDNVIETIPLIASSVSMNATTRTIREVLQLIRQAADYWTEPYELDDVWMEWRSAAPGCGIGYARIVQAHIPELKNPYGQPFYSCLNDAMMEGLNLIVEREPLWRGVPPGQIVGPLYNLIRNPDFSLWNFGIVDSQPDNWNDLETIQITGTNNRQDTANRALDKYSLEVRVSGSTLTGRIKGVTQVIQDIKANTEYTILAWVRLDGVSNGVGRILVTYSSQIELYRDDTRHGWQLYGTKFTTGTSDTVGINCEILTTAANTDGTVYFADLMLIEGDFIEEATNGTLPWIGSSHIVNHWQQPENGIIEAGNINYVDVWDIPGDEDALIRLEVQNDTTPSSLSDPVELIAQLRVGQRRIGDVFNFSNYYDPVGQPDTIGDGVSGNDFISPLSLFTPEYQDFAARVITDNLLDNQGRFRLLARIYDDVGVNFPFANIRLRYFIGAANIGVKTLNPASAPVRREWVIVNLTPNASMVQEDKFSTNPPSQIGYTIQVARPVGSAVGYLDYAMAMPTDGGYLDATIDPPLTNGNALVIDNTASQNVSATFLRNGWRRIFTIGASPSPAIASFRGAVFIGNQANPSVIYRYLAGDWTTAFTGTGVDTNQSMAAWNQRLYAGFMRSAAASVIRVTTDLLSWSSAVSLSTSYNVRAMKGYGGYLFYTIDFSGTTSQVARTGSGANVTELSIAQASIRALGVYQSNLYAGFFSGAVYKRDSGGNWTLNFNVGQEVYCFQEFNGILYIGVSTATATRVYIWDGTTVTNVTLSSTAGIVTGLAILNGKLYASTTVAGVFVTSDGTTWEQTYDPTLSTISIGALAAIDGVLYAVANTTGDVYVFADSDIAYKISNYQGSPFTAPPKKRHRYFFSYDRENFINNVDDAVLVGIGFVPRYLSLRGKG